MPPIVENDQALERPDVSSEAGGSVQEQGQQRVPQGTNTAPTSEAGVPVQEQPTTPGSATATPQISEEERIRRTIQSEVDRKVSLERMRWDQQQAQLRAQQEEAARLEGMDDEELGQYVRQRQAEQAQFSQAQRQALQQTWSQVLQDTFDIITDQRARDEMQARYTAGEFQSHRALLDAVKQAEIHSQLAKERARLEREIRDAVTREITADDVDRGGPQLGQGLPTSSADIARMSTDDLFKAGIQEAFDPRRRRAR